MRRTFGSSTVHKLCLVRPKLYSTGAHVLQCPMSMITSSSNVTMSTNACTASAESDVFVIVRNIIYILKPNQTGVLPAKQYTKGLQTGPEHQMESGKYDWISCMDLAILLIVHGSIELRCIEFVPLSLLMCCQHIHLPFATDK